MTAITNGSVGDLLRASSAGPFMQAEIISLTGRGKLRVSCNWLYSSLNCDPTDDTPFLWQFTKLDDQRISLSPVSSCISQPIYASVRDDIDYYLQVQAPYSADWIKAVGRNEILTFTLQGLSIGQFKGFNGGYVTLNQTADAHGGHTGYRVRSTGLASDQNAQWFIGVHSSLQADVSFSSSVRFPSSD